MSGEKSTRRRERRPREHLEVIPAIGLGLGLAMAFVQVAAAQQSPVTAIDIALEPDATMVQHARAANARLLKSFPKGFSLDATHHPHVSMLQQFVRTDDLDKVFAAANAVLAKEKPTTWTLKAFKYYYIPAPPIGLAGIVVEPTEDLHRLQDALIKAVEPYTAKTGAPVAFFSDGGGTRYPGISDQLCPEFRERCSGQALQSACNDRRRNRKILERNAGGAFPVVRVLASGRIGLSAGRLWHGSEGAQGADTLRGRGQNHIIALHLRHHGSAGAGLTPAAGTFGRRPLSHSFRPFTGPILKVAFGSIPDHCP